MKITKAASRLLAPLTAAALLFAPVQGWGATAEAASAAVSYYAATNIKVEVDGQKLATSPSAFSENGISFVPMRAIFEALGATVSWEPSSRTIIGTDYYTTVALTVGVKTATVNGKSVQLDAAPVEKNGTTFVPVRFVAEALAAKVAWNAKTQTVEVTSEEQQWDDEYDQWLAEEKAKVQSMDKLSAEDIVERYDSSVVMINTTYTTGSGIGSGIIIGDRYILTNYHVIDEAKSASALSINYDNVEIQGVAAYDESMDLAILQTKESLSNLGLEPVEVSRDYYAEKGGKAYALGSPLGVQNTISEGLISNVSYSEIQTSAPIDHGSSGGALFNEYGQLIGITSSGAESLAQLNFAVPVDFAVNLVEELPDTPSESVTLLPSVYPSTLKGASLKEIEAVMEENYSALSTLEGSLKFTDWSVERDSSDWLVLKANVDPVFYSYYIDSVREDLRTWAVSLGYELHALLPGETIQVQLYYDRTFGFEPRGFDSDVVSKLGSDKWRVRYPVLDMQLKDQLLISME